MDPSLESVNQTISPSRVFFTVLAIVFVLEAGIMLMLPLILPPGCSAPCLATVDACLLTLVIAPFVWIVFVVPLRGLAESRQRLLNWALTAQEAERARIARDLHDGLGQSLTSILVGLRTIEESSGESRIQNQARELRKTGSEAHDEIRRLARGLRPTVLDDIGLLAALELYLREIGTANQVAIVFEPGELHQIRLPPGVETAVFRIVQEAATNALKHGHAREIQVRATRREDTLEIEIRDDGRGFDLPSVLRAGRHERPFGLLSIGERANLVGGSVVIDSQPGAGTVVRVRIPYPAAGGLHA